ncbi:hypothetical protein ABIE65_005025 [Constrictibacter sp. MBR-5]|jgi:hypothetical protein|uniref:hypothetical protein n=1 Tax=Constrictibacter sp. MBR-5 TaxID=3156467 RepID=UPI0033930B16
MARALETLEREPLTVVEETGGVPLSAQIVAAGVMIEEAEARYRAARGWEREPAWKVLQTLRSINRTLREVADRRGMRLH